jgi:diketogulonate reductase-like aldo/keto reductase
MCIDRTEEALGKAIKESNVDRKDLFITTKLWQHFHEPQHVRPAFDRSLTNLQMDYVDLYMMHWPMSFKFTGYEFDDISMKPGADNKQTHVPIIDTWREMEKLVKEGLVRSIGVSNFTIPMLEDLLSKCEIPPAVNQVEIHPNLPQEKLLAFCKSKNIALTAYSPIGNPGYRKKTLKTIDEPLVSFFYYWVIFFFFFFFLLQNGCIKDDIIFIK